MEFLYFRAPNPQNWNFVALAAKPNEVPANVTLEHASGAIEVLVDYAQTDAGFEVKSAGLVRTARKLAAGEVFVPAAVWAGH